MKCIQVETIGDFRILEVPMKKPADDEVTIKVTVTGLCRTDLKLIRQGHRDLTLPRIPGEEVVGTVFERGAGVDGVNVGDLVYVYPGIWCGHCRFCEDGAENLCPEMQIMGFHRDGGFAEYVTVPARSVIPVPEGLSPDAAVFAEPLSCCLNALELGRVGRGQSVAGGPVPPEHCFLGQPARGVPRLCR
jgi:L-iditol 2-dehydrogenase